jgi:hypothetical protein
MFAWQLVVIHVERLNGTFYFKLQHANKFMRLAMQEIGCQIAIRKSLCLNAAVFST